MNWNTIEQQGIYLAEAKGLEYSPSDTYGTKLRPFASDQGVDRLELRDMDGDAMVVDRADGHFTLFLNKDHHRVRHRFSVAHELAHLLLRPVVGHREIHRRRLSPVQDAEGRRIEFLCNEMASSILMPRQRVETLMKRTGQSAACVPIMVKAFGVSFEAAARRYVKITPESCVAVFWQVQRNRRMKNQKPPATSGDLGGCWLEFLPPSPGGFVAAAKAIESNEMVLSRENVVLTRRRKPGKYPRYIPNVKVESFGHGRGPYRHIVSFVYIS